MQLGTLAAAWRYPVKSLRAEPLSRAAIDADGLAGDRTGALVVATPTHARAGKTYRGKESPRLHLTDDPLAAVAGAAADGVAVAVDRSAPRWFDAGDVSLLLDLWVHDVEALVGEPLDPLRWRPNLYVTAAPGVELREPDLVGATLAVGSARLRVVATIERCVTTTYDVATGASNPAVLREVAQRRDNVVGVYCAVVAPGEVAVGDAVTLAFP
ncbi:MAG TPA: MOSC domain-containing protein [Candidatus Sulfotelmatobacter sp.]|nr:MOSC domain-containing protein [Candidatus Sulfotelmatobacter sp.]